MKKTNKNKIEEFIRVDHAEKEVQLKFMKGNFGLNTIVKDEKLKKIEEMHS